MDVYELLIVDDEPLYLSCTCAAIIRYFDSRHLPPASWQPGLQPIAPSQPVLRSFPHASVSLESVAGGGKAGDGGTLLDEPPHVKAGEDGQRNMP